MNSIERGFIHLSKSICHFSGGSMGIWCFCFGEIAASIICSMRCDDGWLTVSVGWPQTHHIFFLLSRFDVIVPRCPSYRVIQSKGEWKSLIHSMMMVFMRTISASTVQWHWHIMLPGDDHKSSPFSHMPHTEFDATNDWLVINSWTRKHHTDTHTHTAHNSHALTHTICADESTWLRYV